MESHGVHGCDEVTARRTCLTLGMRWLGVYTLQGLEGTTPLCVLARGVPSFQWAALFENLVSRQVALPRAAWLICVIYLHRHR